MTKEIQESLQVYTLKQIKYYIEKKSVLLLNESQDIVHFASQTVADQVEWLESLSKEKQFEVFSLDLAKELPDTELFYAIITQPYLIVQFKRATDELLEGRGKL